MTTSGRGSQLSRAFTLPSGAQETNASSEIQECIQHQKNIQECKMLPLKEEDILSAYKRVMNRLAGDMDEVVQTVRNNIESELAPSQIETTAHCDDEIVNCQKRVLELFKLKRENRITPREYETRYKEYSDRIISLQAEQIELQKRDASAQLARQRIIEINEVLNDAGKINRTDESIMKMLLDCIKVIGKNEIEFQFKCGTTIKEEI